MEQNKHIELFNKIAEIAKGDLDIQKLEELSEIDDPVPYYLDGFKECVRLGLFTDEDGIVTHIEIKDNHKEEFNFNVSQLMSVMDQIEEFEKQYDAPVLIWWCPK